MIVDLQEKDGYISYAKPGTGNLRSVEVREPIEGNPMLEYVKANNLDYDYMKDYFANRHNPNWVRQNVNDIVSRAYGRRRCTQRWAWAIPNDEAIQLLRKYLDRGIYEIGAGSGYWARMITGQWECGNYYAHDNMTSHAFTHYYHQIITAALPTMQSFETLFLCWPSYDENWAAQAVKDYTPKRIIYVGENQGCTADHEFHELLEKHYKEVEEVRIPQFENIHDVLWVYERA